MGGSYAPSGESTMALHQEHGLIIGMALGLAAWGVLLTLTSQCLVKLPRRLRREPVPGFFPSYVFLVFALGSIATFIELKEVLDSVVDNRNYPGGPVAFYEAELEHRSVNVTRIACYLALSWLANGFLIHRLHFIWNRNLSAVMLPCVAFFASVSLSIIMLSSLAHPGKISAGFNFGMLYYSFSIALSIVISGMIACRLLYMRHLVARATGQKYAQTYMSAAAIFIESGVLYPVCAIVFLVGYSLGDALRFASEPAGIAQGLAPLLIIARMASGNAFSEETAANAGLDASLPPMSFSDVPQPSVVRATVLKGAGLDVLSLRGEDEELQYRMKPTNDMRQLRWATNSDGSGHGSSDIDVVSRSEQSIEEAVEDSLPRL